MADKSIDQLNAAEKIYATDLFVLQQSGSAKKLTGQVLLNWLTAAADGHGGIKSIAKLSTSVLADTYRITLADTTTFDFVVTNGRGITGISKTSTSGLVDTYTISYNNGTTSTFTVKNGAKGDKGDNAYTWFKYASQEPTESSHSIGDIPDDWIGIYSGNSSTAPPDWKQYKWFQIKGEKGNTGDAATLANQVITYQVGNSGTVIPSEAWESSIPSVPQGKYLWTKMELQFNSGEPVVSYSVTRMGLDGAGSVTSVAGVSPDETGNVPLTAADVGASPIYAGAGAHNAIYRGKDLGSSVTAAQWAAIGDGTFKDMYIGDYWTIKGVTYRIAAFDYYYQTGDKYKDGHHVTIVPDSPIYTAPMNDSNSTSTGYVGSKMRTEGLEYAKTAIKSAFGASHIYTHRRYLSNSATAGAWTDSSIELMTEQNVYGCKIWGVTFPVVDKSQYPLFTLRPDMISNGGWFWLRDVANNERFAWVSNYGDANYGLASRSAGVRPSFSICKPSSTPSPEIVSWADGTDEQIAAMVAALEDGTLSVEDTGWAVGDKRTVQLGAMAATGVGESHAAQTVQLVLSHAGATKGITRADGKPIHFQVDQVNSLNESGYMNSSNTNSGSWNGCARRTWCNAIYYAAIPEALRPIFKQMKVTAAETYNGSTLKESEDFFALRAEMEIFGASTYSNSTEAAAIEQIEWYKTAANREKLRNGSADVWWERSPYADGSGRFCRVYSNGFASWANAADTHGLAPFGCI